MKKRIQQMLIVVPLVLGGIASAAETNDLAISLHQRIDKGEIVLDILVANVSTASVNVVSEGIAPPWSIWAWFKWEVDGKPAEYSENVAMIPNIRESWRIPKGGVVLWASIPFRSLKHVIRNEQGQNELRSIITDKNRHSITIMPGRQWKKHKLSLLEVVSNEPQKERKEIQIAPDSIEIGQEDTEPTVRGDGNPAPQP